WFHWSASHFLHCLWSFNLASEVPCSEEVKKNPQSKKPVTVHPSHLWPHPCDSSFHQCCLRPYYSIRHPRTRKTDGSENSRHMLPRKPSKCPFTFNKRATEQTHLYSLLS